MRTLGRLSECVVHCVVDLVWLLFCIEILAQSDKAFYIQEWQAVFYLLVVVNRI